MTSLSRPFSVATWLMPAIKALDIVTPYNKKRGESPRSTHLSQFRRPHTNDTKRLFSQHNNLNSLTRLYHSGYQKSSSCAVRVLIAHTFRKLNAGKRIALACRQMIAAHDVLARRAEHKIEKLTGCPARLAPADQIERL